MIGLTLNGPVVVGFLLSLGGLIAWWPRKAGQK